MKSIFVLVFALAFFVGCDKVPEKTGISTASAHVPPVPTAESFDSNVEYLEEVLVVGDAHKDFAKEFAKKAPVEMGLTRKRNQQALAVPTTMAEGQTNMDTDMLIDRHQVERALQRGTLDDHDVDGSFKMNHNGNPIVLRKPPEIVTQTNYE